MESKQPFDFRVVNCGFNYKHFKVALQNNSEVGAANSKAKMHVASVMVPSHVNPNLMASTLTMRTIS